MEVHEEPGIYGVRCLVNNKIYIGSTINFRYRKGKHFRDLKNNSSNKHLQEDYNKYGIDNFEFIIIEKLCYDDVNLVNRENYWIDKYDALNDKKGYNKAYAVRTSNVRQRENISKALKNRGVFGEYHPGSKLKLSECHEIKQLLIDGLSCSKIAERFNVSASLIKDIRIGHHWSSKELGRFDDWEAEIVKNIVADLKMLIDNGAYTMGSIEKRLGKKYKRSSKYIQRIRYGENKYIVEK